MLIRALIVDDEPVARRGIRARLKAHADVDVLAECADGVSAIESILALKPDVVFLDIQMPELDGFEVVAALRPDRMPIVVFVTAFDQYALRAFDVHALDYLLKPIDGKRFDVMLQSVRERLARGASDDGMLGRIDSALARLRQEAKQSYPSQLAVRLDNRVRIVPIAEIDWIQAAGNYVELHVAAKMQLMRSTLTDLAARLDPDRFVQVSRSAWVQVARVRELQPLFDGDYVVILNDGTQVNGSRRYRLIFARLGL